MKEFSRLVEIIKILRSKKGCKWDRAQKIDNLKMNLLEEVYELLDILEFKNHEKAKEELGDVFLLLVFISELFEEKNKFKVAEALESINEKLITRHPHVFSSKKLETEEEIVKFWVNEKAKNKKRKTVLDRLPHNAPSLVLAHILVKEYSYLGNKIDEKEILLKLKERLNEISCSGNRKKTMAEIILMLVKLAYLYNMDLELLLRKEVLKEARKIKYQK